MLVARWQQDTDRTWPTTGIQVPKHYFSGFCFSPKQPLTPWHRPGNLQAPSQLKEHYCRDTASAAANQELQLANANVPLWSYPETLPLASVLCRGAAHSAFSFTASASWETQDSLQYRKDACDMIFKTGWSDTALLQHCGSFPYTHSQTKGLTQHQFGASIWFQRPLDKKQTKINTKIKQIIEAQLVSIALPLADLTQSNTQEPNCSSSEYNSSARKPAFRCTHGSIMHCTRQNPFLFSSWRS